ncbi:unnamed protein product [marine sediment metagenome]|uniref:C2H2-type domain-containing protein n=1 Tax=marine sediment metagenome TaxID=412755 RepID=X1DSR4_9ZZZZ
MVKRKKPLTCKKCGKKFYHSAKSHPLGRLKKHIVKVHPEWHKATIRKAKRTVSKKRNKLDEEYQYTDDMLAQSLISAGIPLRQPVQQPPQIPIEHESLVGAILTGIALASAGAKLATDIRKVPPSRKKKK